MQSKIYSVKFLIDDFETEIKVKEGNLPEIPTDLQKKNGFNLMWIGSDKPVFDDAELQGIWVKGVPELLLWALRNPLLGYSTDSSEFGSGIISAANSMIYMMLELRHNYNSIFCQRVVEHLKNMVDSEKDAAPKFDLSHNWPYCPLTAAIALARHTPEVWDKLSLVEQEKFDFIMQCFAYVQALGTNDCNKYNTGPGLQGNFGKGWNPNYRLANIPPMMFVSVYFGGAVKVDELLLNFDFDATIERFKKYGFNRAYRCWTTPVAIVDGVPTRTQKDFMENGGDAFINTVNERMHYVPGTPGGTGEGVRRRYTYQGATLDEYGKIVESLVRHNYAGGKVVSTYGEYPDGSPKAYIADHSRSPVEGRVGMMTELAGFDSGNGKDGRDIRSCVGYCSDDFVLTAVMLIVLDELGIYDITAPENREIYELMWVGTTDYLYKAERGYMSYGLGHQKGIKRESEEDAHHIIKAVWREKYGKEIQ